LSHSFTKPVRKVFYNITITALSVAVALIIGTIELVGVFDDQAGINSGHSRRSGQSRWTMRVTASSLYSSSRGSSHWQSGGSAGLKRSGQPSWRRAPAPWSSHPSQHQLSLRHRLR
jgi:hypothetical protein